MQIQKNTVVSLRYVIKDSNGIIIDDTMKGTPVQYLHGIGDIIPSLESSVEGLLAGSEKSFDVHDAVLNKPLHFDVVIDKVREATNEEVEKKRVITGECAPDCCC